MNPSVTSDENPDTSPPNESSSPPWKKQKVSKPKHGLTSKVTTNKKLVISAGRPRNKEQKDALAAKPEPSMWKYLNLPKGRPTKQNKPSAPTTSEAPPPKAVTAVLTPAKQSNPDRKKKHTNWNEGVHKDAMAVALKSMHIQGNIQKAISAAQARFPTILIPRQTLESRYAKYMADMVDDVDALDKFDRKKAMEEPSGVKSSLTTAADVKFLQSLAVTRDNRNDGMPRKEMISIISELKSVTMKKAANHYEYLVRSKRLNQLKNDGRVVTAQATTTNRTAITTEKLLRTYTIQEQAWSIQAELNGWDESKMTPDELNNHKRVQDAHTYNLDESCVMACEGQLKVLGSSGKKKHEKNTADSRDSITAVRVGSAIGVDGPRIYLAKGKDIELDAFKDFTKHFPAPPGSCVEMTPSAYMTDDAWKNIGPKLCQGIRSMDGVQDDCWVVLSLDGFGSHLNADQLLVFSEYKILVIKEEGDTSQVSQAYDQLVAREDKRKVRELMDVVRRLTKAVFNQWDVIIILNEALNLVGATTAWRNSFIRVNFCPSLRQPFTNWVKKHEDTVEAADKFFKHRYGLFDAMPAAWKHLTEEERRQLCAKIDAYPNKWTVEHVKEILLLGYVTLNNVDKIRACYFVTKEDPSVFVTPLDTVKDSDDEELPASTGRQFTLDSDYTGFALAPASLMKEYTEKRAEKAGSESFKTMAAELFCRMTNFVAENHGFKKNDDLVPSKYLDVEVTQDQIDLLKPTPRDVQLGALIDQAAGEKATKAIAKRRVDMVSGNVNSYARILNGPEQIESIKTYNQLAASMAIVRRERDERNEAAKEKKKQDEAKKASKKAEKQQKELEDMQRLGPICEEHVGKGLDHVLGLKVGQRREILTIHFGLSSFEVAGVDVPIYKLNKGGTEAAIRGLIVA